MANRRENFGERSLSLFLAALRKLALVCILMVLAGLIPLVIYGLSAPSSFARVAGTGAMAGAAAFVAGGLVGFLFGIPRALATDGGPSTDGGRAPRLGYRVNTNLEQISDWLTKILVGVGLTQLPHIAHAAGRLVTDVADGMGGGPGATSIAGAVLVYFLGNGFLGAYYLTRTTLTTSFALSDAEISDFDDRMRQIEKASEDLRTLREQVARDVQAGPEA